MTIALLVLGCIAVWLLFSISIAQTQILNAVRNMEVNSLDALRATERTASQLELIQSASADILRHLEK